MSDGLSAAEQELLAPYFTNTERPVFALRLPQEVAGALFSRYSRSGKPLRRVFLEEFLGEGAVVAGPQQDPGEALARARAFYDRVLVGYGDDSVAQLGGAHVACEGISNVAAKLLQDARIGVSFLEKSTRYVRFDQKDAGGRWLYHEEKRILASRHAGAYAALMDRLFSTYARRIDTMIEVIRQRLPIETAALRDPRTGEALSWNEARRDPKLEETARRAYGATVRAHACDVMRSLLPAATRTNVGVFATGQAWEHLLTKLLSQPLAEGRALAALIYPGAAVPLAEVRARVAALPGEEKSALLARFAGARRNRRDKPPRALEEAQLAFDLMTNLGAYRDLQRHRILTQERQAFTTAHGYELPGEIAEAGWSDEFASCMAQAADLEGALVSEMPDEAQYVVPFAFKVRFRMTMNLREAVHFCELRTMPQGHPDYRRVAQEMWRAVAAVHPELAGFGAFVNLDPVALGRLGSELRSEYKKTLLAQAEE